MALHTGTFTISRRDLYYHSRRYGNGMFVSALFALRKGPMKFVATGSTQHNGTVNLSVGYVK